MKRKEINLLRLILAVGLLFGSSFALQAQATASGSETGGGDAALTYHYVHSNTQPGGCGCFGLTGAGLSGTYRVGSNYAAVVQGSGEFASNGPGTGNSLTLIAVLGGVRYYLPGHWYGSPPYFKPFAQVLVGVGHAGGGIAGAGDHTYALAGQAGAGVDIPFGQALALRVELAYYPTEFANASNNRQNNVLAGAGVAYHWSR